MSDKYRCVHDYFSVRKLKKGTFNLYMADLSDGDDFPSIQPGYCVEGCKEKMKEIYRITYEGFLKRVMEYYDDTRIFNYNLESNPCECHLWEYIGFLESKEIVTPNEDEIMIVRSMKVGVLNGKPIRLCQIPEGSKCEIDACSLPNPEEEEEKEESDE